jgi:hypothetical protein
MHTDPLDIGLTMMTGSHIQHPSATTLTWLDRLKRRMPGNHSSDVQLLINFILLFFNKRFMLLDDGFKSADRYGSQSLLHTVFLKR